MPHDPIADRDRAAGFLDELTRLADRPVADMTYSQVAAFVGLFRAVDRHLRGGGLLPPAWNPMPTTVDEPDLDDLFTHFHLEDVVALLHAKHPQVYAYIENTGGGVLCICAAPKQDDGLPVLAAFQGGEPGGYPIMAGPAGKNSSGYAEADLRDFSVGMYIDLDWQPPSTSTLATDWFPEPTGGRGLADYLAEIAAVIAEKVDEYARLRRCEATP